MLLRHDNADQRLTFKAESLGLIHDERAEILRDKLIRMEQLKEVLKQTRFTPKSEVNTYLNTIGYETLDEGISGYELLRRPHVSCEGLKPYLNIEFDHAAAKQVEIECKYEGYIEKARKEANRLANMDRNRIPEWLDYDEVKHLSLEGRQKLSKIRPETLGQASRISGVNPADIAVLAMAIEQLKNEKNNENQ